MFPEGFIEEMRALLGAELDDFLAALEGEPALALRINPLRPGAHAAAAEFCGDPVPWAENGFYLRPGVRPGASLAHACGAFYLQEASAMLSAAALGARPGERILDLCAAPGGKTTQIAAAMRGLGVLVSNEPVPSRARILAENLERLGVVNAIAVCAYPEALAARWPEWFDAVLVDAPCSGEGMFRREPAARTEWRPGAPAGCARRQAEILDRAAELLRPGGRLVYSTCTFNRLEDEGSIESFLQRHPEFSLEDFALPGAGRLEGGMLRAWPHRLRGDGHFVARLRKRGGEPVGVPAEKENAQEAGENERIFAGGFSGVEAVRKAGEDEQSFTGGFSRIEAVQKAGEDNRAFAGRSAPCPAESGAANSPARQGARSKRAARENARRASTVASARRSASQPAARRGEGAARTVAEESNESLVARLEESACRIPDVLRGAPLIRQGDYVHALPPDAPPLDGIRTVKPGLCLLRAGRSHVQPMRALAMAARPDLPEFAGADFAGTALRSAELDAGRAERFLAGERPELDGERGWTLATYQNLPLGFVKARGGEK